MRPRLPLCQIPMYLGDFPEGEVVLLCYKLLSPWRIWLRAGNLLRCERRFGKGQS